MLFHRCGFQKTTMLSECDNNCPNALLEHGICLAGKFSDIYGSRTIAKQCHLSLIWNENICMPEDIVT